MTIRAKLQISTLIQILLVFLAGIVLAVTLKGIDRANQQAVKVAAINEFISELRLVTLENLIRHDERSLQQWQSKYQEISTSLAALPSQNSDERSILAELLKLQQEVKSIFDRLQLSYGETAAGPSSSGLNEFQERLAGQLLVKQQLQIAGGNELAAYNRETASRLLARFNWLIVVVILLILLITATSSSIIIATITRSLTALQQGAREIAQGRLKHRVKLSKNNDEFRRLAVSFNSMAANLQQVDKMKSELIMLTSHQLRTPATAVKGFISMLLDGLWGKLTRVQVTHLRQAYSENEAQLKTINQILGAAKIEAGETQTSKVMTDLGKLIDQVVAEQLPIVRAWQQSITFHQPQTPVNLAVDPGQLAMALGNLINNASKYSLEHADIEVALESSRTSVVIEVRDHGSGIAPSDQKKLFQRFSQLPNPYSNRVGGSGLGLYLAKNIIGLHHGQLTVHSQPGKGTTLRVHLPVRP